MNLVHLRLRGEREGLLNHRDPVAEALGAGAVRHLYLVSGPCEDRSPGLTEQLEHVLVKHVLLE